MESKTTRCPDFESDPETRLDGDRECCGVCRWNDSVSDRCLIGRGCGANAVGGEE